LATATNPARLMGLADRGSIEAGRRADVVALDPDDRVVGVWVRGQPAHGLS
ncbi:MAG: amidohydrolase family protein, partial [Actinobacteria bacterium]|nr:amidohydrolase family protein [Actinomycetota bacterium]